MEPSIVGYISRVFSFIRRSLENPAATLADVFGGGRSDAGVPVNQESATRLTAVLCAVRILSETLASLPLFIYERQEPRGRKKAKDHPLFDRLHLEPNPDMSSFFFREIMQAQVVLKGNAYAVIRRDGAGRPRQLWPLTTQTVDVKRAESGGLLYKIRLNDGTTEPWAAEDMIHIPGLSFDGVKGMSVIGAARNAFGLSIAAEKYGSVLFARGGRAPGVLQTQKAQLQRDEKKNISEDWASSVGGVDNWHKVAVLTKGMEYKDIGITPEDGQFMELRKFQVIEIARIFKVQPHLLFSLEGATFSNIEQQSLEFVMHTMRPWLVRWEQELTRKLLTEEERKRFFIAFNLDGLMRGDSAARGAFYALGSQWGYFSANDIRDLENMPGIGPQGDVYKSPMNMINAKELVDIVGGDGGSQLLTPAAGSMRRLPVRDMRSIRLRRKIKAAHKPLIEERARGIVRKETDAIRKEAKRLLDLGGRSQRDLKSFRAAVDEFYAQHPDWASQRMEPIVRSYAEAISGIVNNEIGGEPDAPMNPQLERFVTEYSARFGVREASESRLQIHALTEKGDEAAIGEAVLGRLDEWDEKRPGKIATREATQFMSAAAKVVMVAGGVTLLRWVANADACPFCSTMDGKVVGVERDFVSAGEGVDAASGDKAPMKLSSSIGHPPLHGGCICDIVAE